MTLALQQPQLHGHSPNIHPHRIDDDIFLGHENARYFVGIVATGDIEHQPAAFEAVQRLRCDTYVERLWLPPSARRANGGELDEHDHTAVHFAVAKNNGTKRPDLIGTTRIILKQNGDLLPVEVDYPEVFSERPALKRSCEVSRLIGPVKPYVNSEKPTETLEEKTERHLVFSALVRAIIGWGLQNNYHTGYAMGEDWLLRTLDKSNIPYVKVADFKQIPEYGNTRNAAISMDPVRVINDIKTHPRMPFATKVFFAGVRRHGGLGYHNKYMLRKPW